MMTAPLAKEQLKLLSSTNLTYGETPVQATRGSGLLRRVSAAVRWGMAWPRRQAALDELDSLSDRQLADIGLHRSELRRVVSRVR